MAYTYKNGHFIDTDAPEIRDNFTVIAPFLFLSTAPEMIAETTAILADIASAALNIELAHSIPEIIAETYLGKAFYINAPDVSPYTDGFIPAENCSIPDYLADLVDLMRETDMPAGEPLCLILQHGAGDSLAVCIPCLN